jgi:hypothetical protein
VTAKKRERLCFEFLCHVLNTRGRFGCDDKREWLCTIGMNENGGMSDKEFKCYINNRIVPLFSVLEDAPRKHILLKVDSSPGCNG